MEGDRPIIPFPPDRDMYGLPYFRSWPPIDGDPFGRSPWEAKQPPPHFYDPQVACSPPLPDRDEYGQPYYRGEDVDPETDPFGRIPWTVRDPPPRLRVQLRSPPDVPTPAGIVVVPVNQPTAPPSSRPSARSETDLADAIDQLGHQPWPPELKQAVRQLSSGTSTSRHLERRLMTTSTGKTFRLTIPRN